MTREGKWPLAAAVAVVLATVILAACGSSDSDSSNPSGTTGATSTGPTTAGRSGQDRGDSAAKPKDQGGTPNQSSPQSERQGGGDHPRDVATPLRVSGGGSAQFRSKGGDNSIQEFGEESESELQEAAEIVHGFYVARAEQRWNAACSYLAKSNVEQLVKLVSQSPEFKGAGCGEALRAFTRPLAASVEREITSVDAGSFRREGDQGFLIYYGANRTVYAMPMRSEDGTWKVTALSGTSLD